MLEDLKNDSSHGAAELIDKAIEIIKCQLDTLNNRDEDIKDEFMELSREIINSQPSMAPLINFIGFLVKDLDLITKDNILQRIEHFYNLKAIRENDLEKSFQAIIRNYYKQELKLMLISYSSTIVNLLKKYKDYKIEIYILESRPLLEGHRTAELLSPYFRIHLIIDAAMGKFMEQVDFILIGIDSILKDGSIINKIGTFPLALVAREKGVKVFAIGDSFKYNLRSHFDQEIEIERKPIREIYDKELFNKNVQVDNYYFDTTPSKYISRIISDLGVLSIRKFLKKVKKDLPIVWFSNFLKYNE